MTGPEPRPNGPAPLPPVWPYVAPLGGFLLLNALEGWLPAGPGGVPSPTWYPLAYAAKIAVTCGLLWACRETWRDLAPTPSAKSAALALAVGLVVAVAWVGLDGHYPQFRSLGQRAAFDPGALPALPRALFLAVRFFGLVAVVPVVEELFYRSFLMRWAVNPDYTAIPLGVVTPLGLALTAGAFGLSHPEWLPALLTGLAWGGLLWATRSVSACVVSHAAANLALGAYVVATGAWKFW